MSIKKKSHILTTKDPFFPCQMEQNNPNNPKKNIFIFMIQKYTSTHTLLNTFPKFTGTEAGVAGQSLNRLDNDFN